MEHCSEHSKVMETLGCIQGQNELLLAGQDKLFTKIESLSINGAVAKVDVENTKARFAPFYWFLSASGVVILTIVIGYIAKKMGII